MPLIGFSAQLIPYIMAMIFTMMVFSGNSHTAADKHTASTNVFSNHSIVFTGNPGATPDASFHTGHFFAGYQEHNIKHLYRRKFRIKLFYRDIFIQTIPLKADALRGPPSFVA